MAEAAAFEAEEGGFVTLPAAGETHLGVFYAATGAEMGEDEEPLPLLQLARPHSKASVQTETDGADRATSVPQELELAGRDHAGCSGSVRSLCSDSSRRGECPICSELFGPRGEALLNCNHALCHRCIAGILGRAKDPGRLQCPFCRQTTPFPQWEIRRLQEDSYSVYAPAISVDVGLGWDAPDAAAAAAASALCCWVAEAHTDTRELPACTCGGVRATRPLIFCLSITALLLIFLVLMGCFLYIVLPAIILSLL